jgi:eukaryotic-like serine/threonine-protein kinase
MIESNDKFGKYALLERLAVGGMAEIFKARTEGVDGFEKILAIKRLHRRLCEDSDFTNMLVDEAKLAVQLHHANIGQVFDLGYIEGQYFIVMEYIDGVDLFQLLRTLRKEGRRIQVEAALYLVARACEALHYAHTKLGSDRKPLEIVHRDVSPQNVMISLEGEIKLVDFGIAKARMRAQETQAGIIKGKFYYMSPEQAYGHRIDARTDVFAMGLVLYEMLAGRNPYEQYDDAELLKRVRQSDFAPLRSVVRDVEPRLIAIVDRALARNVELRFQSALEFQRAIEAYAAQNCPPFSRVEMADYVRSVLGMGAPIVEGGLDSKAMRRQEYCASEASIIYDASLLSTDEHDDFSSDDRTQVFDRSSGEHNHEFGVFDDFANEATSMLDVDGLPSPSSSAQGDPFLAETREEPSLMARAAREFDPFGSSLPLDTQPQITVEETISGVGLADLIRRRPVQLGLLAAMAVAVLASLFLLSRSRASGSDDVVADDPYLELYDERLVFVSVGTVPAGASLRVNGEPAGTTPVEGLKLEVGTNYQLAFALDGHVEMTLDLMAKSAMEPIIVRLEPLQGVLKIATYPPGARVRINGEDHGLAPVTAIGLSRQETHVIDAELPDGRTTRQVVEWSEDSERIKDIQLAFDPQVTEDAGPSPAAKAAPRASDGRASTATPQRQRPASSSTAGAPVGRTAQRSSSGSGSSQPLNIWEIGEKKQKGRVSVRVSGGEEGRVFINEQAINRTTPLANYELDAGTYRVRLYFPTLKRTSETRQVTVRANETATVVFSP